MEVRPFFHFFAPEARESLPGLVNNAQDVCCEYG
jgi:hypothetical protein